MEGVCGPAERNFSGSFPVVLQQLLPFTCSLRRQRLRLIITCLEQPKSHGFDSQSEQVFFSVLKSLLLCCNGMRFKLSLLLLLIIIVIIIQFLSVWHRVIFLVTNKIKMMGLGLHCDKSRCLFIHEKCQLNKIKFSNMRPGGERDRKGKAFIDLYSTKTSFIQSLLHIHLYIHLLTPIYPSFSQELSRCQMLSLVIIRSSIVLM